MTRPNPPRFFNAYTLLLAAAAVYLPLFWQVPLTRAEAMYALIPREMLAAGSMLASTLNGVPYLDKPQLLYWLNMLAFHFLGVADWAARVPTLVETLAEVWLAYLLGRRLVGRQAAWLGGFVLLSSIGFAALHLQILTDHLVTLSLLAAMFALVRWQETPVRRWAVLFHLSLVAGFLSKGFIGLVFPVLIVLLLSWQLRQARLFSLLLSPWGLGLVVVLLTPWLVGMELASPGFLKFYLVNEQVMRFLGQRQPPDVNSYSIPAFWAFLGIWLMPWTLLLPQALWRFWRATRPGGGEEPRARLLVIWAVVIPVFFTLSASRIEYYTLPAFPPLALILGWRLQEYLAASRGDRALLWSCLGMALLGVCLLGLLPYLEKICVANRREFSGMMQPLLPLARSASFLVPALGLAGAVLALGRRRGLTLACYGALALGLVLMTFQAFLALSPRLNDKLAGDFLRRTAAPGDLVIMEHIEEFEYASSLAFYSGHSPLMVQRGGLPQFAYPVAPAINYLITPARLKELWQGPRKVFLLVDDATPLEPFLEGAAVALAMPGKRLLVNRP